MIPPPRSPAGYRIAVVCLGNICRSPVADVVLNARLAEAGLADRVRVASAGTAGWHVGGRMDTRSASTLTGAGYDAERHRARQFGTRDIDEYDLVLAMDRDNLADLRALGVAPDRLRLFRDFDPDPDDGDVPDPYYGGDQGFSDVLAMVERTAAALVAELAERLVEADARP